MSTAPCCTSTRALQRSCIRLLLRTAPRQARRSGSLRGLHGVMGWEQRVEVHARGWRGAEPPGLPGRELSKGQAGAKGLALLLDTIGYMLGFTCYHLPLPAASVQHVQQHGQALHTSQRWQHPPRSCCAEHHSVQL